MTRLFNDPVDFRDEMVEGFATAYGRHVRAVPGGVVRATPPPAGSVAVVVGGGCGHYPAFGGLVGPGLAHGAALGNLFASPSAQQVYAVASAAHRGGGVLLSYGNYTGDVLNFSAAQQRLREQGVDCRTVLVTDDVSSAPPSAKGERRGVAGDLTVFKVAGAAADAGYPLGEVERVARRANERTRSFGVAFGGCTLPGAAAPLFTVPPGQMAVGLGIHGEPGTGQTPVPTADGLAELFVSTLLADLPDGLTRVAGQRAAVVLNGLGAVKYEELFVVYRSIARRLDDAGVVAVQPDVGEFCTSFDMAGASLTLFWLDDELERLWAAPADTPAYRKGPVAGGPAVEVPPSVRPRTERAGARSAGTEPVRAWPPAPGPAGGRSGTAEPAGVQPHGSDAAGLGGAGPAAGPPAASDASRAAARVALRALGAAAVAVDAQVDELGRLDAVAGDGDHGAGMQRGLRAAVAAGRRCLGAGTGTLLCRAGDAWCDHAGGTSGALWGVALRAAGERLGDRAEVDGPALAAAVAAAVGAVRSAGGAEVGDKTMVDAAVPFAAALSAAVGRDGIAAAWRAAADRAAAEAAATADLVPRLGRARLHGERSLGTPDPGAHSFALVVGAMAATLDEECR